MNKRKFYIALVVFAVFAQMFSCAEKVEYNINEVEQEVLDSWMVANKREGFKKLESGVYIKVHDGKNITRTKAEYTYWLDLNYTGQTLDENIFLNTYEDRAKWLGTFSYYTHYVPMYVAYYTDNTLITKAQQQALENMYVGDSVEIYATSKYAYSMNGYETSYEGMGGNVTLAANKPVYMTMRLLDMTKNPRERELIEVNGYAGITLRIPLTDSIKNGLFMKITENAMSKDSIGADTTVQINYVGKFLDGFIFDTNIDSVAKAHNIYDGSTNTEGVANKTYTPISYKPSAGGMIDAFNLLIPKMRKGDKAIFLLTSEYAYGGEFKYSNNVIIQSYTPLMFEIEILKE